MTIESIQQQQHATIKFSCVCVCVCVGDYIMEKQKEHVIHCILYGREYCSAQHESRKLVWNECAQPTIAQKYVYVYISMEISEFQVWPSITNKEGYISSLFSITGGKITRP